MNGHSDIDTFEATEHLKNILNVGKSDTESGVSHGGMESSGDRSSISLDESYQKIELSANKDSSNVGVFGNVVDVYSSPLDFGSTSSQVMVENLVEYGWEDKYYYGQLVCVHLSGLYIAYILKPSNQKPGFVRVCRTQLHLRHLIKDYKCEVKDIAFAHTTSQVLLGSVDACGEFLIHKVSDDSKYITCYLMIRIVRTADWTPSEYNRIIWCLYIPDDNDNEEDVTSDDITTLLVVTHNEKAEIWNIETVIKEYGHGNLSIDEVKTGLQVVNEHKMPISCATFSPDGTALAIASIEGVVKFFQVNTLEEDGTPRCIHQWNPHENKALTSLYFLDNYQNHKPDMQFWKFAVTGADNNTELKLWNCETWKCLQTIRIHPHCDDAIVPVLKAKMDHSSKHLFLSDIKRKAIFIFLIQQDPAFKTASICCLSEYRVQLPILSMAIAKVSLSKSNSMSEDKNSDDEGDLTSKTATDSEESPKFVFKLYWIQTKALQFSKVFYQPKNHSPISADSISSLSQDSYVYKDGLSDVSVDLRETPGKNRSDVDISLQKSFTIADEHSMNSQPVSSSLSALPSHISSYPNCSEVLLTPDDFTSPSHSNLSASDSFNINKDATSKCDPPCLSVEIESLPVEGATLLRRKSSQHSATSSPSREVAEILAPTKILNLDEIASETSPMEDKSEEVLSNGLGDIGLSSVAGISRNQIKEWPQAPDPSKNFRLSSMNNSDLLSPTHFQGESRETIDVSNKLLKYSHSLDAMLQKFDSLSDVVHNQRCDIQSLHKEMKILRQEQIEHQQNIDEAMISNKLENIVSQTIVPHYSRLESIISKKADEERRRTERELINLSNDISATFGGQLESALKKEMSNTVVPQINRVLDTIAQKMRLDFNQRLDTTETSLKENFLKYLKGKAFIDSLSQVISTSLQSLVQTACKDLFQNSVVPSFEKATQHLFQQLNDTFYKGTLEYMQRFDRCSQQSCATLETTASCIREEVKKLVADSKQALNAQTESLAATITQQQNNFQAEIRQAVVEETRKALREQQTAVLNSRSTTPVPISDPQLQKQRLVKLIMQEQFNEAFQEALSAMDVQLVLFVCESVNYDQIFAPEPCLLQQHVLLSLVNQLSADLSIKTDIKVRYLEEVISCLDSNNPLTRDHIRNVLESLQQRISNFAARKPNHKLLRTMKRISLATNSLINK